MSEEQKQDLQKNIEHLEDLDLDTATEEIGVEDLNNGQGIAETGASGGGGGCCSCVTINACCGKS